MAPRELLRLSRNFNKLLGQFTPTRQRFANSISSNNPPFDFNIISSRSFALASPSIHKIPNILHAEEKTYANNLDEYNQVLDSLCRKKRVFLLRDVYEDMLMDGIQPNRETFQISIPGLMRGLKLQDTFFFFNEMKANGIVPDIYLYNSIISTCGRCLQVDRAFQVAEEMEAMGIQPKMRTYVALLNACGTAGRINEAYGVIKRMTLSGMSMNKFCYSALITAYKNKRPLMRGTTDKIFELIEESKNIQEKDEKLVNATLGQNDDIDLAEEQGMMSEMQIRRGLLNRSLVVYHSALRAFVHLRNFDAVNKLLEDMKNDGFVPDAFTYVQIMKMNLTRNGKLEKALESFEKFLELGAFPTLEIYLTLIEGCIKTYSSLGMEVAKKYLKQMLDNGYFLNPKVAGGLLSLASREISGDFSTANMIFDMMMNEKRAMPFAPVLAFLRGSIRHQVPDDDPRVATAREIVNSRMGSSRSTPINNLSSPRNSSNPSRSESHQRRQDLDGHDEHEPNHARDDDDDDGDVHDDSPSQESFDESDDTSDHEPESER